MFKSTTSFTLNNQYNAHTATIKKLGISMCIDNLNVFALFIKAQQHAKTVKVWVSHNVEHAR